LGFSPSIFIDFFKYIDPLEKYQGTKNVCFFKLLKLCSLNAGSQDSYLPFFSHHFKQRKRGEKNNFPGILFLNRPQYKGVARTDFKVGQNEKKNQGRGQNPFFFLKIPN